MNKKVLVSNKDESLRSVIQLILEEEGYEVRPCDAKNLSEEAQLYCPSLILLDEGMLHSKTSAEWCKELKSNILTTNIPVVLLSTSGQTLEAASIECGASGFLLQPFELQDLYDIVKLLKSE